jgi:tRNA(fMet)-specific endonuclease VapC
MTHYLLDTNIVSDMVRNPQGHIAARIHKVGESRVATSIIVASELHYGAEKKASARLTLQLESVLGALQVLPFEAPVDHYYGRIRAELEALGKPIGSNDLLIAAHALSLGHTLVTDNTREFSRVRGLKVENWLRPRNG